jgi:hypothetical protein
MGKEWTFPLKSFFPESMFNLIQEEDRYFLDFFFRHLLLKDPFAYVFMGDKPMAISGYFELGAHFDLSCQQLSTTNSLFRKGCEVFRKYQHLFAFNKVVFFFNFQEEMDYTEIICINKENVSNILDSHEHLFSNVLNGKFNSEKLIEQLKQQKGDIDKVLKNNDELLGILLGYGKNNASLYHRREEIKKCIHSFKIPNKMRNAIPSSGSFTIEDELVSIQNTLKQFENENLSNCIFMDLPHFMADYNSSETLELKKKYRHQRKKITKAYRKGAFLEVTLRKME